jgi:hypothetical protein
VFGITRFVDYRIGTPGVPDMNTIARQVHQLGVLISINHPSAPSGEICLGCGWHPNPASFVPSDLSQWHCTDGLRIDDVISGAIDRSRSDAGESDERL